MKPLKNHTLIYDDECPMCNFYTNTFIKAGMLDEEGREKYSTSINRAPFLNMERARNEIALVNKEDNTITYGLHSIFKIIGHSFPFFKPLFRLPIFQTIMVYLYSFISFNRKVIVPGSTFEGENKCTPTMNMRYRTAYVVFAWLVTSTILFKYSVLLNAFIPSSSFYREFALCGGQVIFQGVMVYCLRKDRVIHYLGNLMTVSLGGSLLLLPMLVMKTFIASELSFLIYFLFVAGIMFLEHIRRTKILELPLTISFSWVLYRILILLVIL